MKARAMNPSFSLYLDLVRFGAACLVYLYHSNMRFLVADVLPASQYGHSAVIVFFVLSGYVIAYVTDTKEKTWTVYAASRLSRVYSVVLPTLALTLILDACGRSLYPEVYDYPFDQFGLRIAGSALMLNEIWFVSITYLSNVPFWSIAFEFWYYVLFGVVTFLRGGVRVWVGIALIALLGPKILLLLPVWVSGVALYRWKWLLDRSRAFSWCLVAISTIGISATHHIGVYQLWTDWLQAVVGPERFVQLTFARYFLGDYLLCALVFMNFAGVRIVADSLGPVIRRMERPIRLVVAYTFTLYLLHQPLFIFWAAVVRGNPGTYTYWWVVTCLTGVSVAVIGYFTENQRQRLRTGLQVLLQRISARVRAMSRSTGPPA